MANFLNKLWPILLAIYIISPFDAHPLFLDDLIASGVLFYFLYKNARKNKTYRSYDYFGHTRSGNTSQQDKGDESDGALTLENAYRLLGVSPSASWDEIRKAYKDRMSKSHPDKVSHLSEELQERAKELSLRLNEALDLIKRHRNG